MARARSLYTLALPLLVAAALAGCGGDKSTNGDLNKDDLERDISKRLGAATGGEAPNVACPKDLPAKLGATIRCRVDVASTSYGVTVTVTDTAGGNAQYDVAVDEQ